MQINAYLNFNGQCEAAFKFYEQLLGGKILTMMTFDGSPMANQIPAEKRNQIIHARMQVGGTVIMASDAIQEQASQPKGFALSLALDTAAEAERVFAELSAGGIVNMPIGKTFFAARFGMLNDRFGVPWMVLCEKEG